MINLLKYEAELWGTEIELIAGVDEAGRGPLAGPIVIAAVILKKEDLLVISREYEEFGTKIEFKVQQALSPRNNDLMDKTSENLYCQINDSKKIPEKRRERIFDFIIEKAISYSIVEITSEEIDQKGIALANLEGFKKAVKGLSIVPDHVLTDHFSIQSLHANKQTNITKGDAISINIAAASILAKVYRDRIMREMAIKFSDYGFEKHKGYGTKDHINAIHKFGPCSIHRRSFEPIKSMYN